MTMTIGIVGLGLIGASLAEALKNSGHTVLGMDSKKSIQDFAKMAKDIDDMLTEDRLWECDVIFIAVPPSGAEKWLKENGSLINSNTIVMDCCGTKRKICKEGFSVAKEYGFTFVGAHPMAGKQVGGLKNSSPELFKNAIIALVPEDKNNIRLMSKIKNLLSEIGFGDFAIMTPEEHDEIIAFTSQMAHLISNAYIKSPMAEVGIGAGLSGGAFRDMTRVAYLDQDMWTELFLENRDNLVNELNGFISELEKYKQALETEDAEELTRLLAEGKKRKIEIDG